MRLCFARGGAGDVLYTVKLPAMAIEEDELGLDEDLGKSRRSSFGRGSFGNPFGAGRDLPDSATEAWGLGVAMEAGGLLRVTTVDLDGFAKAAAVRLGDVVVAVEGEALKGFGIPEFADLADRKVRDALKRGQGSVSLTLANDRVVPRSFLAAADAEAPPTGGALAPSGPPPPRSGSAGGAPFAPSAPPPPRRDDGLPRAGAAAAAPSRTVSTRGSRAGGRRTVSSGRFDADRASWSGLDSSEKRRLHQLRRLLRAGVGAEWHQCVDLTNRDGRSIGHTRRPRPVIVRELGDMEGFAVEPMRAKPIVVPFDALEAIEMPRASAWHQDAAERSRAFVERRSLEISLFKRLSREVAPPTTLERGWSSGELSWECTGLGGAGS